MIALCQFCNQMVSFDSLQTDLAYANLSTLVAAHMSQFHSQDVGREINRAMLLAGAAVAMRYVSSADARLDSERVAAGERLVAAFTPAPAEPLVSLA